MGSEFWQVLEILYRECGAGCASANAKATELSMVRGFFAAMKCARINTERLTSELLSDLAPHP